MPIDAFKVVSDLHRCLCDSLRATGRPKVPLQYSVVNVVCNDESRVVAFTVQHHALDWSAHIDLGGITVDNEARCPWASVQAVLPIELDELARILYHQREELVSVRLAAAPGWDNMRAPGWFVLQLYEALRKATK